MKTYKLVINHDPNIVIEIIDVEDRFKGDIQRTLRWLFDDYFDDFKVDKFVCLSDRPEHSIAYLEDGHMMFIDISIVNDEAIIVMDDELYADTIKNKVKPDFKKFKDTLEVK